MSANHTHCCSRTDCFMQSMQRTKGNSTALVMLQWWAPAAMASDAKEVNSCFAHTVGCAGFEEASAKADVVRLVNRENPYERQ